MGGACDSLEVSLEHFGPATIVKTSGHTVDPLRPNTFTTQSKDQGRPSQAATVSVTGSGHPDALGKAVAPNCAELDRPQRHIKGRER